MSECINYQKWVGSLKRRLRKAKELATAREQEAKEWRNDYVFVKEQLSLCVIVRDNYKALYDSNIDIIQKKDEAFNKLLSAMENIIEKNVELKRELSKYKQHNQ